MRRKNSKKQYSRKFLETLYAKVAWMGIGTDDENQLAQELGIDQTCSSEKFNKKIEGLIAQK